MSAPHPVPTVSLHRGDCLEVMATLPENSFDAIVTDPPYHLTSIVKRFGGKGAAEAKHGTDGLFQRGSRGFMGQAWDGGDIAFRPETWAACLRVLKPGGHLVAFNHSKTFHHMALAIEAAGFEARDSILSIYAPGTAWAGFLDSLSADQIDGLGRALAAADGPSLAWLYGCGFPKSHDVAMGIDKALRVAREKIRVEASQVRNPKATGGGKDGVEGATRPWIEEALRRGYHEKDGDTPTSPEVATWEGWGTALKPAFEPIFLARKPLAERSVARQHLATGTGGLNIDGGQVEGNRWPANVVTDGHRDTLGRFPVDPDGTAARFFYSAKADAEDRGGSKHPTVKPQSLMRWLIRLVTPRGGRVLDPFGGSGATGWAAWREGRTAELIELTPEYQDHIAARIETLGRAPAPVDTDDDTPKQESLF